jgi:hypothetical protein
LTIEECVAIIKLMIKKQCRLTKARGLSMIYLRRVTRGFRGPRSYFAFFGLLCFFLFFLSTPVQSGTIKLPQTGQTLCYNSAGLTIPCLGTGEDGDLLAGVPWPDPRFTGYLFSCIVDNLTGLMWYANPINFSLPRVWSEAVTIPPQINQCGFADWRLPNVNELQSLINAEQTDNASWLESQGFIFPSSAALPYWTSTSSAINPTVNAWVVDVVDGSVFPDNKGFTYFLWPVRGTSNPSPPADIPLGQITETGQITTYVAYDDAYFTITPARNVGVPWPADRFTTTYCDSTGPCAEQLVDCDLISSNNVVTDNLTGLVWQEDANLDGLKTWVNALSYTEDISICGYADWRLPNSKELFSLIDRSKQGPALPTDHPFTNVQSALNDLYCSSTTYAFDPTGVWTVDMFLGGLTPLDKDSPAFVWPVRGGQTRPYILAVEKLGNGQGKVAAPGLTCVGKFCTGDYSSYEVVTVTATANPGSVFTGWSGDACSGITESTCAITMTDDTTATATFLTELKIKVKPGSLNFKNLKQNIPSSGQIVTVTNVGAAPLDILSITITGDDASEFTSADNCLSTDLLSNASCTITVTATSDNFDTRKAQLQISSTDPKKQIFNVKLKAKAKPPRITKKPGSLNFGKVLVGVPIEKTLTLTNKGITDLEIPFTGVISLSGDHPADFFFTPATCPTLATSETCTLTVRFTPSSTGKRSAVLNIPSNDPKKQPAMTVKLKGKGE